MDLTVLYAPEGYWTATDRDQICNGCGTKGLGGVLVPDTLYGLSITEACNIHDWMYAYGETHADKEEADRVFLNNMVRIIHHGTKYRWLKAVRLRRARKYYLAVKYAGGPAYWAGKNTQDNMGIV